MNSKINIVKTILFIITMVVLIALIVIWVVNDKKTVTHTVPEYDISFDMTGNWKPASSEEADFKFRKGYLYFTGYVHTDADLYEEDARQNVFDFYTEQVMDSRGSSFFISKNLTRNVDGKKITCSYFEGTYEGDKYRYYAAAIEFDGSDKFLWCAFSAPAENADGNLDEWNAVLDSIKNLD